MTTLKAHFDGNVIVLDELATLAVGQVLRVIVEPDPAAAVAPPRQPRFGFGRDEFRFTFADDFDAPLDEFAEYR